MRRFLASAWFPFLVSVAFTVASVASFALLKPSGMDIGNDQILRAMKIAGWATGPIAGLLTLILIFILNGIRRIVRLRKISILHPIIILIGVAPWFAFGFQLTMNEPRFTPIARGIIDFVGVPMLWGALVSVALTLLLSLGLLIPKRK